LEKQFSTNKTAENQLEEKKYTKPSKNNFFLTQNIGLKIWVCKVFTF